MRASIDATPDRDGRRWNQPMERELITQRRDLMVRRLILEPGEAMPWHTDSCHRLSVVVRGEQLRIEFRETGEQVVVTAVWWTGISPSSAFTAQ